VEGRWLAPSPGRFTPGKRPSTRCIGGWVGPRTGLDRCRKFCLYRDSILRTVQPVASRYTDWAVAAHMGKRNFENMLLIYLRANESFFCTWASIFNSALIFRFLWVLRVLCSKKHTKSTRQSQEVKSVIFVQHSVTNAKRATPHRKQPPPLFPIFFQGMFYSGSEAWSHQPRKFICSDRSHARTVSFTSSSLPNLRPRQPSFSCLKMW
jgi:hypothetical protein